MLSLSRLPHRALRAVALAAAFALPWVGPASAVTALEVNEATFDPAAKPREGIDPAILRAQVLVDRLRFSPGAIDGRGGENFDKALAAFAASRNLPAGTGLSADTWTALVETYPGPVLVPYTISADDVDGPFLKEVPRDFESMAELKHLGYASPREKLAERFHMSPGLLAALNPKSDFAEAGVPIVVAASRPDPDAKAISNRNVSAEEGGKAPVVRIEIAKAERALRAFDASGALVAFYPASIGSDEKPAPSGSFAIRAIARDPSYTYDPEYGFKGVKTKKKLTIPPGPNNPVGAVWLDLTADSYGIHGTPEPERVGKTFSHGCVRLTNWDVRDLASLAGKGTAVEFRD